MNARTVSERLGCSTQPVMYHFKTMDLLKKTVYLKADHYHSEYLMDIRGDDPMKDIGLNYIRFGATEKNLFRFLFQSNGLLDKSIFELIDAEELHPIIAMLREEMGATMEQARAVFRSLFLVAHGYASMFANNEMPYDEQSVQSDLDLIFDSAVTALKGE